jgi:hypothetical protein
MSNQDKNKIKEEVRQIHKDVVVFTILIVLYVIAMFIFI